MRKVLFSIFLIFLLNPTLLLAQRDSLRSVFLDAESWFLFEEYAEALPLYESLLASDPGNDNLRYKIGVCLLNDPYRKDKAIQYLLDASRNINPAYKENSLKERSAPMEAQYYLGRAYQVNELLDQAIESYEEFLEIMDRSVYDEELVRAQIQSCKNAQRLKSQPVDIDLILIDSLINTPYPDIRPVISGDGTKMAFITELPFYDGAFYTEKTEDGWSYPQMITQMLGFDADVYPVALSHDGTEMILYYDDDYIGNLYYSRMEDGLWTPATKLDENISTKYWESHACFSRDGNQLYFTSNRKGTHGGLDIYLAEKQEDGKWGPPVNLGTTINTRYNEESPYISEDGKTLYFSSYGHYNIGGYDIFYSKKNEDGSWAEPVNMGYPINTTDDDLYFQPYDKGNAAYYSLYSPSGIGRHDVYFMTIYSVNNPRLYLVSGNIRTEDGLEDPSGVSIYVVDTDTGDTLVYAAPGEDGAFAFQLQRGNYELRFSGEDYEDLIRPLAITLGSDKKGIRLEDDLMLSLVAEEEEESAEPEVFEGKESRIRLRETRVEAVAGTPVLVPVIAPKGSVLVVRTYQDSTLISTDTLEIVRRRTQLEIIPLPGSSEVELELSDTDGNIHRNRLQVEGSSIEASDTPAEAEEMQAEQQPVIRADQQEKKAVMLGMVLGSAEGAIRDELLRLDSSDSQFDTEQELFEQLYKQAGAGVYAPSEVDPVLADVLSGGRTGLLLQYLLENSDGALKSYLEDLDPQALGIRHGEELLQHLESVAEAEGFTMEEVREAMMKSLGSPLEVKQVLEEVLQKSQGPLREFLEKLELKKEQAYTVDQLINLIHRELEKQGLTRNERDQILSELFGDQYEEGKVRRRAGRSKLVIPAASLVLLICFFIIWWRQRKRRDAQDA